MVGSRVFEGSVQPKETGTHVRSEAFSQLRETPPKMDLPLQTLSRGEDLHDVRNDGRIALDVVDLINGLGFGV
jgi:hypothetical protein